MRLTDCHTDTQACMCRDLVVHEDHDHRCETRKILLCSLHCYCVPTVEKKVGWGVDRPCLSLGARCTQGLDASMQEFRFCSSGGQRRSGEKGGPRKIMWLVRVRHGSTVALWDMN